MADTPEVPAPSDIVLMLESEHVELRTRFVELDSVPRELLADRLETLTAELVGHFSAEERELFPVFGEAVGGGEIVADRTAEHSAIEERLRQMATLGIESDDFATALSDLRTTVVKHLAAEELHIVPVLVELPSETRIALADRFSAARNAAPAHPHPRAPDNPPGNRLVDSITAVVDRIRDSADGQT